MLEKDRLNQPLTDWYPSVILEHVPLSSPQLQPLHFPGPHSKLPSAPYRVPAPPHSLLRTTSPPTSLRKHRPSSVNYLSALPHLSPKLACLSNFLPLQPSLLRGQGAHFVKG
jgi:hypothetical protein